MDNIVFSDTSYYRLYTGDYLEPKVFFDKDPIKAERIDDKIDYEEKKVAKIPQEKEIKLEDIEKEWEKGIYKNKDINTNPFPTVESLHKFHHEPDFTLELPPFVPSDKIYLNDRSGIEEQWKLYLSRTGQL